MRSRKLGKAVATAVSIDPDLYQQAMRERIVILDTNFSRYVRGLIREDLRRSGMLGLNEISIPLKSNRKRP